MRANAMHNKKNCECEICKMEQKNQRLKDEVVEWKQKYISVCEQKALEDKNE